MGVAKMVFGIILIQVNVNSINIIELDRVKHNKSNILSQWSQYLSYSMRFVPAELSESVVINAGMQLTNKIN